jgi:hypothetical protein
MAGVRRNRRGDDQNETSRSTHFNVLVFLELVMIRASSLTRVSSDFTEKCEGLDSSEVKKRKRGRQGDKGTRGQGMGGQKSLYVSFSSLLVPLSPCPLVLFQLRP